MRKISWHLSFLHLNFLFLSFSLVKIFFTLSQSLIDVAVYVLDFVILDPAFKPKKILENIHPGLHILTMCTDEFIWPFSPSRGAYKNVQRFYILMIRTFIWHIICPFDEAAKPRGLKNWNWITYIIESIKNLDLMFWFSCFDLYFCPKVNCSHFNLDEFSYNHVMNYLLMSLNRLSYSVKYFSNEHQLFII
jgi:hypothetical protein